MLRVVVRIHRGNLAIISNIQAPTKQVEMGCAASTQALVYAEEMAYYEAVCKKNKEIREANARQRAYAVHRRLPGWGLPMVADPVDPAPPPRRLVF